MARIRVSPTEGFILECAYAAIAVGSTITCIREGTEVLPICIVSWVMTVFNIPQVLRFFTDKPARKYYTKFNRAIEILKNPKASEEKKKKAFDSIIEAARGDYYPAIDFLSKIHNGKTK